ncbi:MAG: tyrosine-type recombinase/integrase [Hyphomicrobium sp.]|jgi:site-specific recombinase XerD
MTAASNITSYIEHNRGLGKRFRSEACVLLAFARSVGTIPLHRIEPGMISRFIDRKGHRDITKRKKYRVLARFFRFVVARGRLKASPVPVIEWKRSSPSRTPYIYSMDELKRLLSAVPEATAAQSHIDAETLHTYLLLLYGAGLRGGEARRLKVDDVDLAQALIHVRGTKFFKTRIVPLSTSLNTAIKPFVTKRRNGAVDSGSSLFVKRNGTPLSDSAVGSAFKRLRRIAGLARDGDARNQPRLHDLRHSAAVHRVIAWYRSGADVNDLLPKLATYLGHKDLSGTQHYLTMTEDLLAEASRRFETFARGPRHG